MAGHRYRTNKIKRMHSIIHGLLPILESMAHHPAIAQITPGRISANRRAGDRNITMQYYTDSGMKLLARNPSTVQEVFIVSSEPEEVHAWLVREGLIQESDADKNADKHKNTSNDEPLPVGGVVSGAASKANKSQKQQSAPNTSGAQHQRPQKGSSTSSSKSQPAQKRNALGDLPSKKSADAKTKRSPHDPKLDLYRDYLTPEVPFDPDSPTDELLVTDHLQSETSARLMQLRDQMAKQEQNMQQPTPSKGKQAINTKTAQSQSKKTQATNVKNSSVSTKRETSPTKPTAPKSSSATGKELNPLEAWLAAADDNTFHRLSNKYKGGNR